MPFEDQEEFLTDERIQQNLDSCFQESRANLVFDDNLDLFVGTKSGEKVYSYTLGLIYIHYKIYLYCIKGYHSKYECA